MDNSHPLIEIIGISKRYGDVLVLKNINIDIYGGEVHCILGANGAGKSTLVKIMSGAVSPSEGSVLLDGVSLTLKSPRQAKRAGIVAMYQELDLFPNMTVWENISIDHLSSKMGVIQRRKIRENAEENLRTEIGVEIAIDTVVGKLTVSQQQLVYLAKTLNSSARTIILDEPSASLGEIEREVLHTVIKKLKKRGLAIILISHKLDEVLKISDKITILRDGGVHGQHATADTEMEQLISEMVGVQSNTSSKLRPTTIKISEVQKQSRSCAVELDHVSTDKLTDVCIKAMSGQITGVTGLAGSGHEQIPLVISGIMKPISGSINTKSGVSPKSLRHAVKNGIVYLHAERKIGGIFPTMSIDDNLMVGNFPNKFGVILYKMRNLKVGRLVNEMKIQGYHPGKRASQLSGGNQQKVLLGRCINRTFKILACAEPTRGVDIGGRKEIQMFLRQLVAESPEIAVLVSSDDVEELCEYADKIYSFVDKKVSGEFIVADSDKFEIQRAVLRTC